jgi:5-methylcytosine-specific restriction endonuclease McrA
MADDAVFEAVHKDMEEARAARRRQSGKSPYNDRRWQNRSKQYLFLHPVCIGCGAPSEVCDHVVPLSVRGDDPLLSPIQALCKICHARKWSLEQAFKRGEIA